jgi:hypothetical protein
MAIDLLETDPPPPHVFRFDLESLFYVLVYVVCQYHQGKKIENPPFDNWDHLPTSVLLLTKRTFLMDAMTVSPTSNFTALRKLTVLLHKMIRDGYNARTDANTLAILDSAPTTFDEDTLGDHITFDKFEKILVDNLPSST